MEDYLEDLLACSCEISDDLDDDVAEDYSDL